MKEARTSAPATNNDDRLEKIDTNVQMIVETINSSKRRLFPDDEETRRPSWKFQLPISEEKIQVRNRSIYSINYTLLVKELIGDISSSDSDSDELVF